MTTDYEKQMNENAEEIKKKDSEILKLDNNHT